MQSSKNSTARLDILAAISGVLIAFQSRANGELSRQLDSGAQAALISFSSGLIVIAIVTVFNPKIRFGLKSVTSAKTIKPEENETSAACAPLSNWRERAPFALD